LKFCWQAHVQNWLKQILANTVQRRNLSDWNRSITTYNRRTCWQYHSIYIHQTVML